MSRGEKSACPDEQTRKAGPSEDGEEVRGVSGDERRAGATVDTESGGGNRIGGEASAKRTAARRSASAKKAVATRRRNAGS
jgi:hypothetical protein